MPGDDKIGQEQTYYNVLAQGWPSKNITWFNLAVIIYQPLIWKILTNDLQYYVTRFDFVGSRIIMVAYGYYFACSEFYRAFKILIKAQVTLVLKYFILSSFFANRL